MRMLPDTENRIDDLPHDHCTMWNETGYQCVCRNIMIVGSRDKLYCGGCRRYWNRNEIEESKNGR